MHSMIVRTAGAALVAAVLSPAAFAQSGVRADPYSTAARAPVCTQLELSAGLTADECGKFTLSEVAHIKSIRDNTN